MSFVTLQVIFNRWLMNSKVNNWNMLGLKSLVVTFNSSLVLVWFLPALILLTFLIWASTLLITLAWQQPQIFVVSCFPWALFSFLDESGINIIVTWNGFNLLITSLNFVFWGFRIQLWFVRMLYLNASLQLWLVVLILTGQLRLFIDVIRFLSCFCQLSLLVLGHLVFFIHISYWKVTRSVFWGHIAIQLILILFLFKWFVIVRMNFKFDINDFPLLLGNE